MFGIAFLGLVIFHLLNIYHQYKFLKPKAKGVETAMNFVNGFFALKYLFPFWEDAKDSPERAQEKRKVNRYLYGFYFFLIAVIVIVFIQMPATAT